MLPTLYLSAPQQAADTCRQCLTLCPGFSPIHSSLHEIVSKQCPGCSARFVTQDDLDEHRSAFHHLAASLLVAPAAAQQPPSSAASSGGEGVPSLGYGSGTCPEKPCERKFECWADCVEHFNEAHVPSRKWRACPLCLHSLDVHSMEGHVKASHPVKCPLCAATFRRKRGHTKLKEHMELYHGLSRGWAPRNRLFSF